MSIFSKESLELLREKIDLVEVISPYVNLKKTGGSYKAICPFHNEKSPSFHVQKGDSHYHCFGCGAHGDAIAFLMNYMKLSFSETVEMLAEKFGVTLELSDAKSLPKGPDLGVLKAALNQIADFYHFHLLHTDEGHRALTYLYKRGLDLDFIKAFKVGFAPKEERLSLALFKELGLSKEILISVGILQETRERPFFTNRITFPIQDVSDNVIGFSARKIDEETFGGKYINTPETPLFKKSKVLFGLNHSRKRIAKERQAVIVEGQIDALRLIYEGINMTVASQGTAFGADHVGILRKLGVNQVYLAFDGDTAGKEAALKVGQLFQIEGIGVSILKFKAGDDPDTVIQKEGSQGFLNYLKNPSDYIAFLVETLSSQMDTKTPSGKNELAQKVISYIKAWNHPLMIHEGVKKLAKLLEVPESLVEIDQMPLFESKKSASFEINPDRILESDLIRWLLLSGSAHPEIISIVTANLQENDFLDPTCKKFFGHLLTLLQEKEELSLLKLGAYMGAEEQGLLEFIHQKKVNGNKAKSGITEVVQKMLERRWMIKREEIKNKIQTHKQSEEEVLKLAKEFDLISKEIPKVVIPLMEIH